MSNQQSGNRSLGWLNFESVFIDSQALDLSFQGRPRELQFRCSPHRPRNTAATVCECGFDHLLLLLEQRAIHCACWTCNLRRLALEPGLVHKKCLFLAQDDGPLNYILKFTNVPWPVVLLEQFESFSIESFKLLSRFFPVAIDKILDQQWDVLCSFSQRRHVNRHDVEPVQEILPELAFGNKLI